MATYAKGQKVWWRGNKRVLLCTVEDHLGGTSYFVRVNNDQPPKMAGKRLYSKASSLAPYREGAGPPPIRPL